MWPIFQQLPGLPWPTRVRDCLNRLMQGFPLVLSLTGAIATAGEWEQGQDFRSKSLEVVPGRKAGFTLLSTEATGITSGNYVPESRHLTNQIFLNGSGVAAGDQ